MIIHAINQQRTPNNSLRMLRISSNVNIDEDSSLVKIKTIPHNDNILAIVLDKNGTDSYFLPWNSEQGNYIDLPKDKPNASLFITSELSGCFVGVQDMGDVYRVRHYNFGSRNIDLADFRRFTDDDSVNYWLVPDRGNIRDVFLKSNLPHEVYVNYSASSPAIFWAEYTDNVWNFYYQTTDNTIHLFLIK